MTRVKIGATSCSEFEPIQNTSTEDTNVSDDKIQQTKEDTRLSTADLVRSANGAGPEERRREVRHENSTQQNRDPGGHPASAPRDVSATRTATAVAPAREEYARLFSESDAKGFRAGWENLQVSFVDEPRHAVEQADSLVAEAIKRLRQQSR